MYCPKCGFHNEEGAKLCAGCGCPMPAEPLLFGQPKKGSHWPPVIIMAVMVVLGLIFYFLFPLKDTPQAIPLPTEKNMFEYSSGTITSFDPAQYDGSASLTIPDTVDSLPVVRIGASAFADCDSLEEIILPQHLLEIGNSAFEGCDALRGIYIPATVLRIGSRALAQCSNLEAVYLNGTIETIEADAFADCLSLRFIFFDGTSAQWQELFTGEVMPFTYGICSDGMLQQGPAKP